MAHSSTHRRALLRLIPLVLLFGASVAFLLCGGRQYLTFASLAQHREFLSDLVARGGALSALAYVAFYAGVTALSLPGAMLMTIAGGFLFGPWLGALYALIGATAGASAEFLAARAGLSEFADKAGPRVQGLTAGFRDDALSYLLVLRLVPVFPFWLVNLVAGASGMRLPVYVAATFLGMIPGALVYAGIGSGVSDMIAAGGHPDPYKLFRPNILLPLLGLAALSLLPVLYKRWNGRRREAVR
ncbi:MAG TPA: TVP38/TMEM64 family protein [Stellaceae bacterium]|jgi:uncharacterized membrane protein YdjX (TVP38/TMEM64 family)|nr:TVP38/TMEM64 family protein [Stellaceae bacterium]